MAFMTIGQLRTILTTETDADSPGSQELMDQLRENFETLLMLYAYAGFIDTVSVIAEEVLTWAGNAQVADEHIGRTLLIASGDAIGNMYTIDDNAEQTLTCTGDTLATDGVDVGDTFMVFYDLKPASPSGHSHNGVDSSEIGIAIKGGGLDTGTDTANGNVPAATLVTIDMVDYSFFPNIYTANDDVYLSGFSSDSAANDGRFGLYNTHGSNAYAYFVRWRYMTVASAPMIFVIQDKNTGAIEHIYMAEKYKHVKRPKNFQSPLKLWQNNVQIDMSNYNEIAVFNYSKSEFYEIRNKSDKDKRPLHKFVTDDYEYDTKTKIFKPKNLLSI